MLKRLLTALAAVVLMCNAALAVVNRAVPTSGTLPALITDLNTELATLYTTMPQVLATVAGTNTITATVSPSLTAYTNGAMFWLKPANDITGAATLNINSLGAKSIVSAAGTAVGKADLQAATIYLVRYYASSDHFRIIGNLGTGTARSLTGSATYNPPNLLALGVSTVTTVTVTGAVLGDGCIVSFSLDAAGVIPQCYVSAADTVSVIFQNLSGGTVNLASGTLSATVLH